MAMTRHQHLLADIRALGWAGPVRAAYEASKRAGGHRLAFGALARLPPAPLVMKTSFGVPDDPPRRAKELAVARAETILAGSLVVFGKDVPAHEVTNWHDVVDGQHRWPKTPWWQIDIRSDARIGDVKWAWEVGRSRHLVQLARGVYASPDRDDFRISLELHLRSWLDENPPEIGIHWYSNLEIALRTLAWLQVIALCGDRLDPSLVANISTHIVHAGRHLLADLPYTLSTMRNNHLLGDSLGLLAIGRARGRRGRTLTIVGEFLSWFHGRSAFQPDGSMIEDSLSYHRFVLEMLVVRRLLDGGRQSDLAVMVASAQFLARLGALEGPVPQYGDWDEGRVLVSSGRAADVAGTVRLALSLAGTGSPPEWRDRHDECAWYVPLGQPVEPQPSERDGRPVGGGLARAARGPFVAWLKAGGNVSHQHADLCSTLILCDGEWAVGDPGTGTYNGPLNQRNYFRCSVAHSVLRVHGCDQLGPYRAFRWLYRPQGVSGGAIQCNDIVVMPGAHDAYARLQPGGRIARAVMVGPSFVLVVDWAEFPRNVPYALSLPLSPGSLWDSATSSIRLVTGKSLLLTSSSAPVLIDASVDPFDAWWSETYGSLEHSSRLELRGRLDGPVWWALSLGEPNTPNLEGNWIGLHGLKLRADFSTSGVELTVRSKRGEQTVAMELSGR